MFTLKKTVVKTELDEVIDQIVASIKDDHPESEEFDKKTDQLVKLYKLKAETKPARVSPDTLAVIAANLTGIMMIVGHERANVVTSKALGFLLKLR